MPSRAERLLNLLEELRRRRHPVSGAALASHLGISLRSLYRDIASLRAQGATIEGEAGFGYILRPGFTLPPLMFSEDELEALVLGSRWVAERADQRLAVAAANALSRISAVLPPDVTRRVEDVPFVIGPARADNADAIEIDVVRRAIRRERKLTITYRDSENVQTTRLIWPFQIGYFDGARLVSAWCELRDGIRHFRTDRIEEVEETEVRYPRRRHDLAREWRRLEGVSQA